MGITITRAGSFLVRVPTSPLTLTKVLCLSITTFITPMKNGAESI